MNAEPLFKLGLLACFVLSGGQALADPHLSTPSPYTVNSISFSYMNYSQPPASYFHRQPPFNGLPPPLPAADPPASAPGPIVPSGQTGTPPLTEPPNQLPVVVAVLPEPGTFALLGLGLVLLAGSQVKKADSAK